ncbi:MAG: radical SAM protein [Oscillochloris sp.]|nr:radical SAM protein [Oscillochloris sp.]
MPAPGLLPLRATPPERRTLYFNAQRHFLTISEDLRANYSFDREGRFLGSFLGGVNYRRGLRGDILMKRAAQPTKERRMLGPEERQELVGAILERVTAIRELDLSSQSSELLGWLDQALRWDVARAEGDRATFQAIYKPISILPPDQYLALVLQAAEGCSWNRCSFCTFYRDRRFRIKTPGEFRQHIQQIKAFLGAGLGFRKSIFLGDANALIVPQPRLRTLLQIVHEEFAIGTPGGMKGIYAFLDIFGAEQKDVADFRELRDALVRRVYIGLESGDDTVSRLLNKPGSPAACVEAVRTIKAAGINVGIILLAGAGGTQLAGQHVHRSLAALSQMGLGEGDIVYVSPLIVPPDGPYAQQLAGIGGKDLAANALTAQLEQIKAGARAATGNGTKVALYHIEEFIY